MTASTFAAVCSAAAAVGSVVAAFKAFALAKRNAECIRDGERRNLEHDIDETARAVEVKARRAESVYERIKPLQDSVSELAGNFVASARSQADAHVQQTKTSIAANPRAA